MAIRTEGALWKRFECRQKFKIVLPRRVRESLRIRPGQEFQALVYEGRMELIPLKPISQMRGFLRGIDTDAARDASSHAL
jgi:bifunctional DNA-binding transcriptional regulator/antitoxin component of YhaV-PrlF toxin-antitoxin module